MEVTVNPAETATSATEPEMIDVSPDDLMEELTSFDDLPANAAESPAALGVSSSGMGGAGAFNFLAAGGNRGTSSAHRPNSRRLQQGVAQAKLLSHLA